MPGPFRSSLELGGDPGVLGSHTANCPMGDKLGSVEEGVWAGS